jgi:hypothetical protein
MGREAEGRKKDEKVERGERRKKREREVEGGRERQEG